MAKTSFKALKREADDIYKRYEAHFAGKPRATRDLELLDLLIGELDDLANRAKSGLNGGRDPAMISLLDMAKQNLQTYKNERSAIVEAKDSSPASTAASRLITEANLAFGRYHRHFANRDRRGRDTGLLSEIIVELERIHSAMKALENEEKGSLGKNVEIVENNLDLYRQEFRAIDNAQENGTAQEQADTLANLANAQFALYRDHFAGRGRHTRRPGMLERMINQLKQIHRKMFALKQGGLVSQANDRNMEIVSQNLDVYQAELEKIREARAELTTEQLAGSLGGAANEAMQEYRDDFAGANRATRDLDQLSLICDRLCNIAYQMRAIDRDEPTELNAKNLGIVLDAWTMYETEYRKIEEVQND